MSLLHLFCNNESQIMNKQTLDDLSFLFDYQWNKNFGSITPEVNPWSLNFVMQLLVLCFLPCYKMKSWLDYSNSEMSLNTISL